MDEADPIRVTVLLSRLMNGDRTVEDELFSVLYPDLRRMAGTFLRRERTGHTLQPTALVNEVYLRLVEQTKADWKTRVHFFGAAAGVMRRVLIDYGRKRTSQKRGGGAFNLSLEHEIAIPEESLDLFLYIDQALTRLAERDPRQAKIVELRYFGGLTEEEVALLLELSSRTVKRDWQIAKLWMKAELASPRDCQ